MIGGGLLEDVRFQTGGLTRPSQPFGHAAEGTSNRAQVRWHHSETPSVLLWNKLFPLAKTPSMSRYDGWGTLSLVR